MAFLLRSAALSCLFVALAVSAEDTGQHCEHWAKTGECTNNWAYMQKACPEACARHASNDKVTKLEEEIAQLKAELAARPEPTGAETPPGPATPAEPAADVEALQREAAEARAAADAATAALAPLQEENASLSKKSAQLEQQLQEVTEGAKSQKDQLSAQLLAAQQSSGMQQQTEEQFQESQRQLQAAQNQLQEAHGQMQGMQAQCGHAIQERDQLLVKVEQLNGQREEARASLATCEAEKESAAQEHAKGATSSTNEELQTKIDSLQEDKVSLKQQLADKEDELRNVTDISEHRNGELEALAGRVGAVQTDLEAARAEVGTKQAELSNATAEVQRLTAALSNCELSSKPAGNLTAGASCPKCPEDTCPTPSESQCTALFPVPQSAESPKCPDCPQCPEIPPVAPPPPPAQCDCGEVAPAPAPPRLDGVAPTPAAVPAPQSCPPPPPPCEKCEEKKCDGEVFALRKQLEAEHAKNIEEVKNTQDAVSQKRVDDNAELAQELQNTKAKMQACDGKLQYVEKALQETKECKGRDEYEKQLAELLHDKNLWADSNRTLAADLANCQKALESAAPAVDTCTADLKKKTEAHSSVSAALITMEEEKNRCNRTQAQDASRALQLETQLAQQQKASEAKLSAAADELSTTKRDLLEAQELAAEPCPPAVASLSAVACGRDISVWASATFFLTAASKLVALTADLLRLPVDVDTEVIAPLLDGLDGYFVRESRFAPFLTRVNTEHISPFLERHVYARLGDSSKYGALPESLADRMVLAALLLFASWKVLTCVICFATCGMCCGCRRRNAATKVVTVVQQPGAGSFAQPPPPPLPTTPAAQSKPGTFVKAIAKAHAFESDVLQF
ncbi:unnamed protein product [Amoebophrya sp. A25]|nr:unnamed protein product [Amoebophrya sp. A25]|eukprot:GSA25T00000787001.1